MKWKPRAKEDAQEIVQVMRQMKNHHPAQGTLWFVVYEENTVCIASMWQMINGFSTELLRTSQSHPSKPNLDSFGIRLK